MCGDTRAGRSGPGPQAPTRRLAPSTARRARAASPPGSNRRSRGPPSAVPAASTPPGGSAQGSDHRPPDAGLGLGVPNEDPALVEVDAAPVRPVDLVRSEPGVTGEAPHDLVV